MPTVQLASEPASCRSHVGADRSIWLVISMALLARLIWVNHAMARRLRSGSEIDDPSILNLVRECASAAGLRRTPCIVETTAVGTPAVYGVWKPRILMPVGLMQSLPASQRRHVILHELSHIRHQDVLANWLFAVLAICHWFNPLLWLAMSRLKADRELARDAWVIRFGSRSDDEASTYADTLIDLAQRLSLGQLIAIRTRRSVIPRPLWPIHQLAKETPDDSAPLDPPRLQLHRLRAFAPHRRRVSDACPRTNRSRNRKRRLNRRSLRRRRSRSNDKDRPKRRRRSSPADSNRDQSRRL